MATYFQLAVEVSTELGDPELISLPLEFVRQLSELALCLLLAQSKATTKSVDLGFPADLLPGIVDYLPLIDVYAQTPQPDVMLTLAVRDSNQLELARVSARKELYFDDAWTATAQAPTEYYFVGTNLLGVRRAPTDNIILRHIYVPYIEVLDLEDQFPLDDSYLNRFKSLLRALLMVRMSNFQAAKREVERFLSD